MINSVLFESITKKQYLYNIQSIDNIDSIVSNGILSYKRKDDTKGV